MAFDTVHTVRRHGARRFFSTDQLNPHRKKRLFYGLPSYSTVRCGAVFKNTYRTNYSYGAVRFVCLFTVRCGADRFFLEFCGAVRRGFVRGKILRCGAVQCGAVRCGAVKPHRTTPHRKKKARREKP